MARGWKSQAVEFLTTGKRGAGPPTEGVRPRKKLRTAAKTLAFGLDNALAAGVGISLRHFQVVEDTEQWGSPWQWPRLIVSGNQGPDNVAMYHPLAYGSQFRLNITILWDFSHGGWNDWRSSLKQTGRWPWFLLSLACFNRLHGPWNEAAFYQQLLGAAREYLEMLDTENLDCPVLAMYMHDILTDAGNESAIARGDALSTVIEDTFVRWAV